MSRSRAYTWLRKFVNGGETRFRALELYAVSKPFWLTAGALLRPSALISRAVWLSKRMSGAWIRPARAGMTLDSVATAATHRQRPSRDPACPELAVAARCSP